VSYDLVLEHIHELLEYLKKVEYYTRKRVRGEQIDIRTGTGLIILDKDTNS
jgi:hypothetical protein